MHKRFLVVALLVCLAIVSGPAQTWTPYGSFSQGSTYSVSVQPPIKADNSSTFAFAKKGTVPVKFTLSKGLGDLTIIATDINRPFGGVYIEPNALTVADIYDLHYTGEMTGSCGGGSPRFQIGLENGKNVFVYLGPGPSWAGPCGTAATFGPEFNVIDADGSRGDTRYDTMQIAGGKWNSTWAEVKALVGSTAVKNIVFVVDSYMAGSPSTWYNPHQVTLQSVTLNGGTYSFARGVEPTCELPPATIGLLKTGTTTFIPATDDTFLVPADTGASFRIDSCQYVYNLGLKTLDAGTYEAYVFIDNTKVENTPAKFSLK